MNIDKIAELADAFRALGACDVLLQRAKDPDFAAKLPMVAGKIEAKIAHHYERIGQVLHLSGVSFEKFAEALGHAQAERHLRIVPKPETKAAPVVLTWSADAFFRQYVRDVRVTLTDRLAYFYFNLGLKNLQVLSTEIDAEHQVKFEFWLADPDGCNFDDLTIIPEKGELVISGLGTHGRIMLFDVSKYEVLACVVLGDTAEVMVGETALAEAPLLPSPASRAATPPTENPAAKVELSPTDTGLHIRGGDVYVADKHIGCVFTEAVPVNGEAELFEIGVWKARTADHPVGGPTIKLNGKVSWKREDDAANALWVYVVLRQHVIAGLKSCARAGMQTPAMFALNQYVLGTHPVDASIVSPLMSGPLVDDSNITGVGYEFAADALLAAGFDPPLDPRHLSAPLACNLLGIGRQQ